MRRRTSWRVVLLGGAVACGFAWQLGGEPPPVDDAPEPDQRSLPAAANLPFPEVPRWTAPSREDEARTASPAAVQNQVRRTLALPSGVRAVVYPERARSPRGHPLFVRVELSTAQGQPLTGQSPQWSVLPSAAGWSSSARTGHFSPTQQPGHYRALVLAEDGDHTDVLVTVREPAGSEGNRRSASALISVDRSGPASFHGPLRGTWNGDELTVRFPVLVNDACEVELRAEVVDARGRSLGEMVAAAEFSGPMIGELSLMFPANAEDRGPGPLWVSAATLFADGAWSDFWADPRRVTME